MTAVLSPGVSAEPRSYGPLQLAHFVRYAGASGDFNPLHFDDDFAKGASFPGIFSQGMHQAALLGGYLAEWVGPAAIRRYGVRFRDQVWPGDTLTCTAVVDRVEDGPDGRRAVVVLTATRDGGAVVLSGTAEVALDG